MHLCIVPLPDAYMGPPWTFGIYALLPLFRKHKAFTENVTHCNVHILPEHNPWETGVRDGLTLHNWLQASYPPFNDTQNVFLHFSFCDLVSDCAYLPQPFQILPPSLNPASPHRRYTYVAWNGRGDGHDSNQNACDGCMQRGKDIVVATGQNACGPLCGGNMQDLKRFAVWNGESHETLLAALKDVKHWPPRRYEMFWAGQVAPARMQGSADPSDDPSGRGQFWRLFQDRTGWSVTQTYDWKHDKPLIHMEHTVLEMMRNATFCFSPLGRVGGDHDRYIPAILTGCIPVVLSSVTVGGVRQPYVQPFEDVLDWHKFAVVVDARDIPRLPDVLAAVDVASKRAHMAHVWRKMLWTKYYGSYLGETGDGDAFDTLVEVLLKRSRAI